jgi:uncharacterized membrane protein
MGDLQIWLHITLLKGTAVAAFMRTNWGWPTIESIHFVGLTLLFGTIATWDLRLLGMARRVPIAEFHRLVPFGVLGFAINASSGSMFLMTEPNQYVYNPAFQFKMLFLVLAGLNVLVFYTSAFRRLAALGPGVEPPLITKLFGATSLICWIAVIVCGRLITFYRPGLCSPAERLAFILQCIPTR